ncbi:M57 family metalloprotease [Nocardioides dubius]|uniref:Peptidase metallopeptidase domain-containing protein n=1 Tax=Nocardioides dubius TaxID=317019 RepID=A0ABP4EBP6_9ACTN
MNLRTKKISIATATIAVGISLAGAATAAPTERPTFQEFAGSTYRDADGTYIVNGDEPVSSTGSLRTFYDAVYGSRKSATHEEGLVVNTVGGVDDAWSDSQIGNLTYCVSNKFGTRKADVVAAMSAGAAMWENASSAIDFRYLPAQDASCTVRNNAVLFSVEPVSTTQYIARAFFPSTAKRTRNVLIDDSFWAMSYTQANVLGHELGHTLGFRHEHTRPESGACFEDNNWRPLTPYDRDSIMHYPQCNGVAGQLTFSSGDVAGVQALYGS